MFEHLDEKFDMTTDIVHSPVVQTPIAIEDIGADTVDEDVAIARQSIRNMIDIAQDAVKDLANIAKTAESPRAFEVLGQLIKTVSDSSKDLLALQKTKHDMRKKTDKTPSADVVNNNLFVGTTNEIMQLLQGKNEKL